MNYNLLRKQKMIDDPPKVLLDQIYSHQDFSFRYPGYWEIEEQKSDDGLTVTVSSDEGCFWMLNVLKGAEDPIDVINSAIEAFTDEYEQIDVYEREDHPEHGWSRQELEFECSDFIVTAVLQAIQLSGFSLLLLMQGQDQDFENYRETFEAITNTLSRKPMQE